MLSINLYFYYCCLFVDILGNHIYNINPLLCVLLFVLLFNIFYSIIYGLFDIISIRYIVNYYYYYYVVVIDYDILVLLLLFYFIMLLLGLD